MDSQGSNPYISVLSILCNTLQRFDDNEMIPCYGFGDSTTHDTAVFSFAPGDQPIHTLENVLEGYRALTGTVRLSGPTSFAPIIHRAMKTVADSGGRYHILVIICDGSVRSVQLLKLMGTK